MGEANNRIQEIAEGSPFGIPVTISCDPMRHEENLMREASERDRAFSLWPEPLGFAAIGDPALCRHFGDNVTCCSRPIVACSANLISFHVFPVSDVRYNSSSSNPPSRRPVVGVMNFSCPNTGGDETRCQFRPPSEVLNKSEMLKAVLEFWRTASQPAVLFIHKGTNEQATKKMSACPSEMELTLDQEAPRVAVWNTSMEAAPLSPSAMAK